MITPIDETITPLDPKIKPLVILLREAGIDTFTSCQGGPGHAFDRPTIRFNLDDTGDLDKVAKIVLENGYADLGGGFGVHLVPWNLAAYGPDSSKTFGELTFYKVFP